MNSYRVDWVQVQNLGEKIVIALLILIVTWLIARAVKWAFAKLVDGIPALRHHTSSGDTVGHSLGRVLALLVWLLGLVAVLQVFELDTVLSPLRTLLDQVGAYIPRIIGAGLIFYVGLIIARIVKQLIETSLQTVDFDRWMSKAGVGQVTGSDDHAAASREVAVDPNATNTTRPASATTAASAGSASRGAQLSSILGTIVYVLIIIPFAIAALDVLNIPAITVPAREMLQLILEAVPLIIAAAIWLALAYFIAKWVAGLIEQVLPSLGFDRALQSSGLAGAVRPSRVISTIVVTAIMLFAAVGAARLLNFPELSFILAQVLELGGRVLFGAIVIVAGVWLGNLIASLMSSSSGERGPVPTMVKYLIVAVATFMGLTFMEVGEEIVVIAFAGVVFAAAVGSALAFGLGGRSTAHKLLDKWTQGGTTVPTPAPKPPRTPTPPMAPDIPVTPAPPTRPVPPSDPSI